MTLSNINSLVYFCAYYQHSSLLISRLSEPKMFNRIILNVKYVCSEISMQITNILKYSAQKHLDEHSQFFRLHDVFLYMHT
jgi:hypothetical protein